MGRNAAEIYDEVVGDRGIPSLRTVQVIAKLAKGDASDIWSVTDSEPEDAALLLPVVAALISKSAGRVRLTVDAAAWVLHVRRLAADLPPYAAWQIATFYQGRHGAGLATTDVDALLAFAPWRGPVAWVRYKDAVDAGWVTRPYFSWLFSSGYRDMYKGLGFHDWFINAARSYDHLLALEAEFEATGTVTLQEGKHDDA